MSELIQTKVIPAETGSLSEEALDTCLNVLENSGVLLIPTDTVYGLACNAFDPVAIKKIYSLKGRRYSKPLPILLASVDQVPLVAKDVPKEAYRLTKVYWPGPLTLVFKTAPIAMHASRGKDTIATRVPDYGLVRQLLEKTKLPLAATSANLSGDVSIKKGQDAIDLFNEKVDVIVDGGVCRISKESSVVDATHYPFTVLRQGALSKQQIYQSFMENV